MIPEDTISHAAQQLTAALKRNLPESMRESGTIHINKLDAMFNIISKNFRKWNKKQHPQLRQKTPTPDLRSWEEPAPALRVSKEPEPAPSVNTSPPIIEEISEQNKEKFVEVTETEINGDNHARPQMANYITQDEDDT